MAGCGKLARLAMPLLEAPAAQLRAAAEAAPRVRGARFRGADALTALAAVGSNAACRLVVSWLCDFPMRVGRYMVQDRHAGHACVRKN